jgi:DNA-binding response OmpR family regulator
MVVDDEEDVCMVLKWGLQKAGLDVDAFTHPRTALQYFKPYRYDLVLIDLKMPDMDGLQFYQHIKDIQYDVKACFMTAANSNKEFVTKRLPGNNKKVCVAGKPIRIEELMLLIGDKLDVYEKSLLK